MPNVIRNFQAVTTRKFDVIPAAQAKNLDRILTGLESRYDHEEMLRLLSALVLHIGKQGTAAHTNLRFTATMLVEKMHAILRTRYNVEAADDLSQPDFDTLFTNRPDLVAELLRRLRLIELGYVEGVGLIGDFYMVEADATQTFSVGSAGITIRPLEAVHLLGLAPAGNAAHYLPLTPATFPLPRAGNLLFEFANLNDTPGADRPLAVLAGNDFTLRVTQTTADDNTFDVGLIVDDEEEEAVVVTLPVDETIRRLMIIYDHTGVSVASLSVGETLVTDWVTVFERQTLTPTSLTIYPELILPGASEGPADLLSMVVAGGRPSDADILYRLTNAV